MRIGFLTAWVSEHSQSNVGVSLPASEHSRHGSICLVDSTASAQFCSNFEQRHANPLFYIERNLCGIMVIMLNALFIKGKIGLVDNFVG
jgi:hypothetical protein